MYGQAHHMATGCHSRPGFRRRWLQPGRTRAAAVSAAGGGPARITGARTRWHDMRSPAH